MKSFENTTALNTRVSNSRVQTKQRCHICSKVGHLAKNCFFLRNTQKGPEENKQKKYCTFCKKSSHNIDECWLKRGKELASGSKKNDEPCVNNAFMVYTEKLKTSDWCVDSGASGHMCWEKSSFDYINSLKGR